MSKAKTRAPQITPRVALTESTVGVAKEAPRRPFTRNLTLNVGKRKYLVVGGVVSPDKDGYRPYVAPQVIAKRLGLDLRDCVLADPRELGKIEAARTAGLAEYNVVDLNRRSASSTPVEST